MIARLLILLPCLVFGADTAKVLRESSAGSTRNLVLLGRMDRQETVEKALSLLGAPEVKMGRLVTYPSEEISRMVFREDQESCIPQDLISFLKFIGLRTDPLRCPAVSEAIKIGSGILLRTVDSSCHNKSSLLQGTANPLVIHSLGEQHELLAISVGVAPNSKEVWGSEYPKISVFVRTQAKPSAILAKDILGQMQMTSGARDAKVVLRNDSNFGKYCDFPQPYLFGRPVTKGQEAATVAGSDVICVSLFPHPVQCWSSSDSPTLAK
jgi:hypothetical protein